MNIPPILAYKMNPLMRAVVMEWLSVHGLKFCPDRIHSFVKDFAGNPVSLLHRFPHLRQQLKEVDEFLHRTQGRALSPYMAAQTVLQEVFCAEVYLNWWVHGKHIFQFPEDLVAKFLLTDVDSVPCDLIKFPFASFYLSFGLTPIRPVFKAPGRAFFLDGAYIVKTPRGLTAHCTHSSPDRSQGGTSPVFVIDLADAHDVGGALQKGKEWRRNATIRSSNKFAEGPALLSEQLNSYDEEEPILIAASKLIVNAILYTTFCKDEIVEWWLNAPEKLLRKLARSTTEKDRQRNISKLWNLGFTPVSLCGAIGGNDTDSAPTSREVSSHWRRGYWRLQACGPGFTERRLTWVRPTIVRRDKGDPDRGHLYR